MSTVELTFTSLPTHVRTARLIAVAVARLAGLDAQVLDEVRLAVGEACSRAVDRHRRSGVDEQIRVSLTDGPSRFVINVHDRATGDDPDVAGSGGDALAELARTARLGERTRQDWEDGDSLFEPLPAGVGIAVIDELVDDLDLDVTPQGSTLCMSWPLPRAATRPKATIMESRG